MPRASRVLVGVFLSLLVLTVTELPAAARVRLPPITVPASGVHHPGKVIFVELATPDLAVAEHFYAGLFGWTFRDVNAGRTTYAEAMLGGEPVAGLFQRTLPARAHHRSAWLPYFSATDVDALARIARADGGRVLFGPRSFPDRGREAIVRDPEGAVFALLDSTSGDPPDLLVAPGAWIWNSLITGDPNRAAGFYQKLFGYDVYPLASDAESGRLILASGGFARASVNPLPVKRPTARAHWLSFVRVTDVRSAAARATALGGRILVAPRLDHDGTMLALMADPLGAVFGVIEWPPTANGEQGK